MSSRPPEPPFDPDDRWNDDVDRPYRRSSRGGRADQHEATVAVGRRRPPLWMILGGLVALVLLILFAVNLTRGGPGQDRLDNNGTASNEGASGNATAAAAADPAARCATRQTYNLVKAELFRQAAATRGSDQATFDRLANYATLRMDSPVLKRQDQGLGTIVCSGRAAIDLPPGVVVAGGRTSLSAQLDYALQPAADNRGTVVTLAGADPITIPLATAARATEQTATDTNAVEAGAAPTDGSAPATDQTPAAPGPIAPSPQPIPVPRAPTPPPAPTPDRASADPGFNCRYARTRGEIAVCGDDGLALLDRRMTSIYVDALRNSSPGQNALLHQTRDRFLAFRDRCGNNSCIAGAYRDRIREISDIMAGRWQP